MVFDPTDLAEDVTPAATLKALGRVRLASKRARERVITGRGIQGGAGNGVERQGAALAPAPWAGALSRGPEGASVLHLARPASVLAGSSRAGSPAAPPPRAPLLQGAHLKALLMAMRLNDPQLVQHVVLRWGPASGSCGHAPTPQGM